MIVITIPVAAQPPWARRGERVRSLESHVGYLFVDGEYVEAPYQVTIKGDKVIVNDRVLVPEDYLFESSYHSDFAPRGRRHRGFGAADGMLTDLTVLKLSDVVIFERGHKSVTLSTTREGQTLLKTLISDAPTAVSPPETLTPAPRETWNRLVDGFSPTPEFLQRARAQVESYEQVRIENEALAGVAIWSERVTYPLTVFAMIVVVLAFGHLLSHKPQVDAADSDSASSSGRQMVLRSLVIVGLLSIVDLVWTIVAWQSGSMRELNPLGNQLIDNPIQLAVFKLTVVSGSIGLLYWLHQRPIAQVASWWSCLLLTLVTARWLTFNAMFL